MPSDALNAASNVHKSLGAPREGSLIRPAKLPTSALTADRMICNLSPPDSSVTCSRVPALMPNLRRKAAGKTTLPLEDTRSVVGLLLDWLMSAKIPVR